MGCMIAEVVDAGYVVDAVDSTDRQVVRFVVDYDVNT